MKKIIAIIIFTLNTISVTNAQECKYLLKEKDEFTKAMKIETGGKFVQEMMGSNAYLTLRNIDSSYYLNLYYNVPYAKSMAVGTNNQLMIKLENDSILFLNPTEATTGNFITTSDVTVSQIKINYHSTKEQLLILSQKGITKIRINFTDGYKEHEIKIKNANEIKKAAYCLIKF